MFSFVGAGTYRGMKDTRTPLLAAGCAMAVKLALNALFIYGGGRGAGGDWQAGAWAQGPGGRRRPWAASNVTLPLRRPG